MKEIKFEGVFDTQIITDYLEHLSKSIKSGKLLINKGSDELMLEPEGKIEIKVEAKQKKNKEKFELKMNWERSPKPFGKLKIS